MSIRMAPKLTDKHITVLPFSTMQVNLAAKTLGHSVAAGINTLCTLKCLPDDASATAEFTETCDQLFNAFNSASFKSSHKHKNALSEISGHIPFLKKLPEVSIKAENSRKYCCTMFSWLADINKKVTGHTGMFA